MNDINFDDDKQIDNNAQEMKWILHHSQCTFLPSNNSFYLVIIL